MIEKVILRNWKKHEELEVDFSNGSNIIIGRMGSGKTSVLQAIAFGLFGTFSELKKRDVKLPDLINKGSGGTAEIEIRIRDLNKNRLVIKRRIEPNKISEATIRDQTGKLLAGPNPTAVNQYIADRLKIDEEVFLRTIYSLQNEADILLRLSPAERKKQIDELMNLDKFEVARKSCVSIRNKFNGRKNSLVELLVGENKGELSNTVDLIVKEIAVITEKSVALNSELKNSLEEEGRLKSELDKLRSTQRELDQLVASKNKLSLEISEIKLKLAGKKIKTLPDELDARIGVYRKTSEKLKVDKEKFGERCDELSSKLISAEKEISVFESREKELTKKISKIIELRQKLSSMESEFKFTELSTELARVKAQIKEADESRKENSAEINNLRKHLHELEVVGDSCPICSNALSVQTKASLVSERKREIARLLMENNDISQNINNLSGKEKKFEELYESQKDILGKVEEENKFRSEKELINKSVISNVAKRLKLVRELDELKMSIKNIDIELGSVNSEIQKFLDDKYLAEISERQGKLVSELGMVEEKISNYGLDSDFVSKMEQEYDSVVRRTQEIRSSLESSKVLVSEKDVRLKELRVKLEKLEKFEIEISELGKKVEFLDKLKNALIETQEVLRDDLILAVNEVMSSVWVEIYPYDGWSGLRLSTAGNDYTLQLKESSGDWVNVAGFASGGERMLASLAAKIAFSRVLAPYLSMLILDEPTHNLDETAVMNFVEVIHEKVSEFIDQIFIITHDERLAESATKVVKII